LILRFTTDGTIALFIGSLVLFFPDKNPFQSMQRKTYDK